MRKHHVSRTRHTVYDLISSNLAPPKSLQLVLNSIINLKIHQIFFLSLLPCRLLPYLVFLAARPHIIAPLPLSYHISYCYIVDRVRLSFLPLDRDFVHYMTTTLPTANQLFCRTCLPYDLLSRTS